MCEACLSTQLPIEEASEAFDANLSAIARLHSTAMGVTMLPADQRFATDLIHQFTRDLNLSPKQWYWVNTILGRYTTAEPIYGSFNAILVMFRFAQAKGLKRPRIRLLSSDPEPVYFELWFRPGEESERTIEIMRGGWQGHGRRQFSGWVKDDRILPWRPERLSPGMRSTIQDLSLDPAGVALAMAKRLSACMYCGQRLSDDESKAKGYGPVCADTYGLPWGKRDSATAKRLAEIRSSTTLDELWSF